VFKIPPYFFYCLWHLTIMENVRYWLFWSIPRDWKCLKYSIRHLRLHTICPECGGDGRYYNSYDIRDCSTCKTTGFTPVRWWHVKDFFGATQFYHLKKRVRMFIWGCDFNAYTNFYCVHNVAGCTKHPRLDK
jgi:hypothetical protein